MILIGEIEGKRTTYFKKAAEHLGFAQMLQMLCYCDGMDFLQNAKEVLKISSEKHRLQYCKIDPPSYDFLHKEQSQIDSMYRAYKSYYSWLLTLPEPSGKLQYLNTPKSLSLLLDKYKCKERLIEKGLETKVTPCLGKDIKSYQELKQKMKIWHCPSVFIKPNFASGAAGILAYRCHPSNGQELLYTSVYLQEWKGKEIIINTKKMFCYKESEIIEKICSHILSLGTIIERWIPKAEYQHYNYDLRVLYQFHKIAFITVRQSKGPITNLHLNNKPLITKQLGKLPECLELTKEQISDIEKLCYQAASVFDGLSVVGIDILLEKKKKRPLIIEMNGQGDLLYQDIYHENSIYKEQVAMMAAKERVCKES